MTRMVTSTTLQHTIDQWEHMFRYGLNTPDYFIVHDEVSLKDLFQEWCEKKELDNLKMYRFLRDSDLEPNKNLPTSVETLAVQLTAEHVAESYLLAMPYIEESDFIFSGWVKAPTVDKPFDLSFGFREDHHIPYEDNEEYPCQIIECDPRESIPHDSYFFNDVKRAACGFSYPGVRMTWSVTKEVIGRNRNNLCFWDYQVDEAYVRE